MRLLRTGWTEDLQKRYFAWFVKAAAYRGGASFRKFVDAIKNDALSMLNDGQKVAMKDILEAEPSIQSPLEAIAARSFVKEWSASELQRALSTSLKKGRDFDKGRKVFGEAACFYCHRFGGEGGALHDRIANAPARSQSRTALREHPNTSRSLSSTSVANSNDFAMPGARQASAGQASY